MPGTRARQFECEATRGPLARAVTSQKPSSFRWLTSIHIPSCWAFSTTSTPNGVSPPFLPSLFWEKWQPSAA